MDIPNEVDRWAKEAGFSDPQEFRGTGTKVGADPRVRYSGFYLLSFTNNSYYLGESVNLRGRMGGHRTRWGSEIVDVRLMLQNLSKPQLRNREKHLIHALNKKAPTRCRNVTHASVTAGKNELVEFLDEDEQEAWLANPFAFNAADTAALKPMTKAQATKYSTAARRFKELSLAEDLTRILHNYLDHCVPAPRRTEFQSWNVSAYTLGGRRAFCVSIGKMETFFSTPDGRSVIVVRESVLLRDESLRAFKKRHRDVRINVGRVYEDAGNDQMTLHAPDIAAMDRLLADPAVQRAAAQLVLDVMRKHPSCYTRYHCPQLVEHVYHELKRPKAESETHPLTADEQFESGDETAFQPDPQGEGSDDVPVPFAEDTPDEVPITWFVNAGPAKSGRNTIDDFVAAGEWRMLPQKKYETLVQEMLPGERIVVRKRYNTREVPFDNRGLPVSAMDILLTGTITANPGDGCSVGVAWDPRGPVRTWFLYTNQDPVWAIPRGQQRWGDLLVDFVENGTPQDLDLWRNISFWRSRFGDEVQAIPS